MSKVIKVGDTLTAIVIVNNFTGSNERPATADRNGKMPVILRPLAGTIPNVGSVVSGTVAENNTLLPGKRYLVVFTRLEDDTEYGPRFQILNGGEVTTIKEVLEAPKDLGAPETIQVTATVNQAAFTETE